MCSFLINWGKRYFSMHKLSSVPEERYHRYKTFRFCLCWERMQSYAYTVRYMAEILRKPLFNQSTYAYTSSVK